MSVGSHGEEATALSLSCGDVLRIPPRALLRMGFCFFDWNSIEIGARAQLIAQGVAQNFAILSCFPGTQIKVEVGAHTDASEPAPLLLSQRRADAVAVFLRLNGIPADRIETFAYGTTRPLVRTTDGIQEPSNRRVELMFR